MVHTFKPPTARLKEADAQKIYFELECNCQIKSTKISFLAELISHILFDFFISEDLAADPRSRWHPFLWSLAANRIFLHKALLR